MFSRVVFVILFLVSLSSAKEIEKLPSLRQQNEIRQEWLKLRLERVLPRLMRKHKIEMWLVICREYNEDPLFFSLVSPNSFSARRLTILVFFDKGTREGIEKLALGGGSNGGLYRVYRDPDAKNRELWGVTQWTLLRRLIEERNPETIAINISSDHAFSDGLSSALKEQLQDSLGEKWKKRIMSAGSLPLEYLQTRISEMEPIYSRMMRIVHALISQAFSSKVIIPGKTTNMDVAWWLRQQVHALGMDVWFHPTVFVQRKGATGVNFLFEGQETVIERGDILHTDFGIKVMGLNMDTQHMGYVLLEGETDVPPGLKKALANANRLQDILMKRMKPGRSGNEVFQETIEAMNTANIKGAIYTHPIGDHGHGAGPLVGLWDRQESIPIRGELPMLDNTWFSIELSSETPVPEWGNDVLWIGLEEDAILESQGARWVLSRQSKYHLVR